MPAPSCSTAPASTSPPWATSTRSPPIMRWQNASKGRPDRFHGEQAMATATKTFDPPNHRTIADLLEQLGDIPAERVRFQPCPGTATERDVIDVHDRENRLCELVDGTLVEKVMGFDESIFAVHLAGALLNYL